MRAPHLSDWRRATVGDLTSTLLMDHVDTSVPALPPTRNDPSYVAAKGCTENRSAGDRHQPTAVPGALGPEDAHPGDAHGQHRLRAHGKLTTESGRGWPRPLEALSPTSQVPGGHRIIDERRPAVEGRFPR